MFERFHHALPDASGWNIDHSSQTDIVITVERKPKIGECVFDFFSLVEPNIADNAIRDPFPRQRVLNGA
jgi:hypothetical protein